MKYKDITVGEEYQYLGTYVIVLEFDEQTAIIETRLAERTEINITELFPKPEKPDPDTSTPATAAMVQAIQVQQQQEQIDQLANLIRRTLEANCMIDIQNHALSNHLTVLQCDQNGDTHELLLSITYIENCDEAHCGCLDTPE